MTLDRLDCIGAGSYYTLEQEGSADAGLSPATGISTPSDANLKSPNSEIRIDPTTGERYCLSAIVSDLRNPDWYVRIRAAWALRRTCDVEAVVPLVEALHDEQKAVRDWAQEALQTMETTGEPLPVRVLLCDTVDDAVRTDMLLALTDARSLRGLIYGYGSAKAYCQHLLDEETADMDEDEQAVLACLKRAAAAVLSELSNRSDANLLLRAGDANSGPHHEQLLRSCEPGLRPGEVENLLLPASEGAPGP